MQTQPEIAPLRDLVNLFPNELSDPKVRQRLRKAADALDTLIVLDEHGELAINSDSLRKIAQDTDIISAEHRDLILRETKKHVTGKVKTGGRLVGWREAARKGIP